MESCSICGGSRYTDALKVYNKGKPAWCMPRKGTVEHAKIKEIMERPKKSTRKLRKAPVESVTNLGKEGQKRIEEFTDTEPIISSEMEVKKTRKLRKVAAVEEKPKEWYEHKLWSDGTYTYELDPVLRKGNNYFFKNLTSEEDQKRLNPSEWPSAGFVIRANKNGLPPKMLQNRKLRPI